MYVALLLGVLDTYFPNPVRRRLYYGERQLINIQYCALPECSVFLAVISNGARSITTKIVPISNLTT